MNTIVIAGGDLFRIALQQLGDPTQWNRIASANKLTDPVLRGLTTLVLPSVDATAGGGFAK